MNIIIKWRKGKITTVAAIVKKALVITMALAVAIVNLPSLEVKAYSKTQEIVFIDSAVKDSEVLMDGIRQGLEVVYIDSHKDGISQISEEMSSHHDIDAIHIISHGESGKIFIGNTVLSEKNIKVHTEQLKTIGKSLKQGGDVLIYGCDVAQGKSGLDFIQDIANITKANVAASSNITGDSSKGGDWNLENSIGSVHTEALYNSEYNNILLPNDEQDTSIIFDDTGNFYMLDNGQQVDRVKDSDDFTLSWDGDLIAGEPAYFANSLGLFIVPKSGELLTDDNTHWFRIDANNTSLKSFKLKSIKFCNSTPTADNFEVTVTGYTVDGGTVSDTTNVIDSEGDYSISWDLNSTFSNSQITGFKVAYKNVSGALDAYLNDFCFSTFTIAEAQASTVGDSTPPTLSDVSSDSITSSEASISATSNEDGTMYYVITTSSTAPSKDQVKAGKNGSGGSAFKSGNSNVGVTNPNTFDISGLSSSMLYYYYIVSEDGNGNISSVSSGNFTTLSLAASTEPLVGNITVTNNNGTADTVVVNNLAEGDVVRVYDSSTGGSLLGTSSAVGSGETSATVTIAQLGTGAGNVYITVTSTGKIESNPRTGKGYDAEPSLVPTVTGISPSSGSTAGGTGIIINGTNLSGVTAVKFGTTDALSFEYNGTGGYIEAISPPGSEGTVHVTVITVGGTSATSIDDQFTYILGPSITGNPNNATVTAGDNASFTVGAIGTGLTYNISMAGKSRFRIRDYT